MHSCRVGWGSCRSARSLRDLVDAGDEAGGQTVVVLVKPDDGHKSGALEDAVCFGGASAGEDFAGVGVSAKGQDAVGDSQQSFLIGWFKGRGA